MNIQIMFAIARMEGDRENGTATTFRSGAWLLILLLITSLAMTGCSAFDTKESTQFQAAIPGIQFNERQVAKSTELSVSKIRKQGYFEIGRIHAEQFKRKCDDAKGKSCEDISHDYTTKEQALKEAAKRGGDAVAFSQINAPKQEVRYRNGSCLSSRQQTQLVSQPTYSYECRQVGNNTECTNRQTGSTMVPQVVTVCTSYEQIPYWVNIEQSKGTVWRYDKDNASKYSKMVDYSKSVPLNDSKHASVGPSDPDLKPMLWLIGGVVGFYFIVMGL